MDKQVEAHDSELQKLHDVRIKTEALIPSLAPSRQEIAHYGVELARLVVHLVDSGNLKSRRRYSMAKAVIAAYEADKAIAGARA